MSVTIEPAEQLEFHRPFTRISKESLHVKNPGDTPVIFKVKTTAPKQYCVRPNAGRIEPNSEIEVQIILQPFKEELPEDYKCKDKFLVQTAPIYESFEQQQDITSMWTHIETTDRASMHQHKIKCVFAGPREEETLVEEKVGASIPELVNPTSNNIASSEVQNDIPAVPIHKEQVVPRTVASIPTEPIVSPPTVASTVLPTANTTQDIPIVTRDIPSARDIPAATDIPAAKDIPITRDIPAVKDIPTTRDIPVTQDIPVTRDVPTIAKDIPTTAKDIPTIPTTNNTNNDKERELKEALEKIKRLEQQLNDIRKEEGIRPRLNNNNSSSRKLASTVQPLDAVHQHLAALEKPRADEGYPPQVVLLVAGLVFIFTYLFF